MCVFCFAVICLLAQFLLCEVFLYIAILVLVLKLLAVVRVVGLHCVRLESWAEVKGDNGICGK